MKLKTYFLGAACSCMLWSCSFLETEPFDYIDGDDLYHTPETCMAGLAGIYDALTATGAYGQNLWGDLDAGTDILVYNRNYGTGYIQISNYNYNNSDKALLNSWTALYNGINRANDFIERIGRSDDAQCGGPRAKAMYLGEAKALRALCYMNLVAFWGEVPLRLEPTYNLDTQLKAKATQAEIYAQITADLKDAAEGCLDVRELPSPGRMSQTAAEALLARAYMWQAGYPLYADTWGEALNWARKVADSGRHNLLPRENGGYRQVFINMCSNLYDLSTYESMFEIEFYGNGQTQTNEAGRLGLYIGVTQQTPSDNHPYAYGLYDATKYLFRLYEDGDDRQWWNIADYKYVTTNGVVSEQPRTTAERNQEDGNAAKWRAKYIPERPLSRNNSSINFPVMRFSDVLLMVAECSNHVYGRPTTEAFAALNRVRRRAGASEVNPSDAPDFESFNRLVIEERTRELCFEVPRRMELRRHGADFFTSQIEVLADQSLNAQNKKTGYDLESIKALPALNMQPKHIYFPIPQAELNVNTACTQNVNW